MNEFPGFNKTQVNIIHNEMQLHAERADALFALFDALYDFSDKGKDEYELMALADIGRKLSAELRGECAETQCFLQEGLENKEK